MPKTLEQNADNISLALEQTKGKAVSDDKTLQFDNGSVASLSGKQIREDIMNDMKSSIKQLNALRTSTKDRKAADISLGEFVQDLYGFANVESFFTQLNVNPGHATIESLMTMPEFEEGYRWLVPEVIREAIRLGLRKDPIYNGLIAAEETVTQTTVHMPKVNMSDAQLTELNEGETIPTGSVSFDEKIVKLTKLGTGIKLTDEVEQYVALNVLALYLQDVGVKLNIGLDSLAVTTLINGDQADGSEAAPVIGVTTPTQWEYKDLLRSWLRLGILGRTPSGILSNEGPALDIMLLPEFKGFDGNTRLKQLNINTPIPQTQNYWVHGTMPDTNQIMMVDTTSALMKLNATALKVESERIVERQINGTFVTLTTGFASMFRDARLIVDKSLDIATNGFPSYMDAAAEQKETFKQ